MDLGASMTCIPAEVHFSQKDTSISFSEVFQQTWAALSIHCMVIMVGMNLGFSAILLPQLEEPDSDIKITRSDASWLASVVSIVAPIGSLGAGPFVQWIGSKNTIRLSLIPYAIGWLLISFANGLPMLLTGRIITGLATTFGNTPCIVYITEVSSPHLRPMLTATGPTIASFGILISYTLGWLFSWRTVALVPAVWNLICIIALATIPESPIWLISHKKYDEAKRAIYWFHRVKPHVSDEEKDIVGSSMVRRREYAVEIGVENVDDEVSRRRKKAEIAYFVLMKELKVSLYGREDKCKLSAGAGENLLSHESKKEVAHCISLDSTKGNRTGLMKQLGLLFTKPTGLKPLVMLTTIFLLQQYAGVYITLFYAVNVFKEMGGGAMNAYIASIMVGLLRFFMSLVNIWLFRRFGRRPLCLLSALGMTLCMLTSGTSIYLTSTETFPENVTIVNGTVEPLNLSMQILMKSGTPSFLDDKSGDVLRFNFSLDEQIQPHEQRSEMPLSEASTDYSTVNGLQMENFSEGAIVSRRHGGKENHSDSGEESHIAFRHKEFISSEFDGFKKSSSFLEKENEVISTVNANFSDPHASGPIKKSNVVPTVCLLLYVCVSMVGFLAIPWTITAELFPTEIRSLANSVVLSVANILLFSALLSYPHMLDALGPHGVLWMFAAVSATGGLFFYFFLPETHGRNLSEIEKYFSENTVYTYPCKKE